MEFVGRKLGRYHLNAELGDGGMGAVYRAATDGGSSVAVKVLHPHLLKVPSAYERFRREAEFGRAIQHPNVVQTLEADSAVVEQQSVHYLVMEYVEGQTLQELLGELGHLPEELCCHIGGQVARALGAIHDVGAVHRDLKPANVIITSTHEVKVMDFGIAYLTDEVRRLSTAGDFVGSVLYAAPEQWDPKAKVDGRADLFALGILMYELATGRHPFAGLQGTVPISALARAKPEPASATNPELSSFYVELLATLLQVELPERFPSAELLHRVLKTREESDWWQERSREVELSGRGRVRRLQVPREARVCGREPELDRLHDVLELVRGGHGQVALIEGESGIGKTRLVDEFVRLEEDSFDFLFGAYTPGGAATASGALSAAFCEHLGRTELEKRLRELLPEMPGVISPFADLLRGTGDGSDPGGMSTDTIAMAFAETARAMARSRPLVLFLDNIDFAPREARIIFAALAHAIREEPILLIGAFRPGTAGEAMARVQALAYATRLRLQRLGPQDMTALLTDALGSLSLAQHLGWEIARKSDGNPLYVFEILRDLRELKRLVRDDSGSWRTTGLIREIETPHSVRDLLRARLKHVSEEDRDLLDVAACAGPRFDPAIVAEAAGAALVPALKRFRRLERDYGIVRPDGRVYVFDHHQMQEAIYEDLFEQLREQYHLAVGQASESAWADPTGAQSVELCRHFLYGGLPERARPHLLPALNELRTGHLHDRLRDLGERALAAGIPESPRERFRVLGLLSSAADQMGDWKAQGIAGQEMMGIADALGDEGLRLHALVGIGVQKYHCGQHDDALPVFREALALAIREGDRIREEEAERGIGICWGRRGDREKALLHHRRSLELCEALGLDTAAAAAHTNVAIQLVAGGDLDAAEAHYRRAIELARATGHARWEANATANYGRIFFLRGDYAQAWSHALRFRELSRHIGDRRGEATSGIILVVLWTLFGAIDEIEHEVARVETDVQETGDRWLSAFVIQKRAWLAEQRGELAEARRLMDEAIAVRRAIEDREGLAVLLQDAGALAADEGDAMKAVALLEEALSIEEAEPWTRAGSLCELAAVQGGGTAEAERALEEAVGDGASGVREYLCLWKASGDARHLERAHGELEDLIARVPEAYRESARTRLRLNRTVQEAWERRATQP